MGNPLTRAGNFDRRVTILRRNVTTNAHNEEIEGVPTEVGRWASVRPAPGTERFQSAEMAAEAPMRFVFRWEANLLTVKDSIRHDDGNIYAIAAIAEIGLREGIEVLATARADVQ